MTILIRPACKPIRNLWQAMGLVAACLLLAVTVMRASAQYQYPFQSSALPLEARVNNVLSLMTVEEKNCGDRAGEEVVQLYVQHLKSKVPRPIRELRGFKRVELLPGERKRVERSLPTESLAYWDEVRHSFVLEGGRIELLAGSSSADIRLKKTITVDN